MWRWRDEAKVGIRIMIRYRGFFVVFFFGGVGGGGAPNERRGELGPLSLWGESEQPLYGVTQLVFLCVQCFLCFHTYLRL